jgi:N-methylhydantoinase A
VLVPPAASGGSAFGLLEASESVELVHTAVIRLDDPEAGERCARLVADLEAEAGIGLWGDGATLTARRTVGMRYAGQGHEIQVPLVADPGDTPALAESFHGAYERTYGYREESQPVEAVSWSLALVRECAAAGAERIWADRANGLPAPSRRHVFFPELGEVDVAVHLRDDLLPGDLLDGPLLVAEPTTTTVVLPGDLVEVTADGTLVIRVAGAAA